MFGLAALGILLAQVPASESQIRVWNDPVPRRRTAISGRIGLNGTGLGIRHHWFERVSTELFAFAIFGQRQGQYSLGLELRLTPIQRRSFWLHLCAPFAWDHRRQWTEAHNSLVPDHRVDRSSDIFFGFGPGVEIFVHPLVSFSMEFTYGLWWRSDHRVGMEATSYSNTEPNAAMGLHVYFR